MSELDDIRRGKDAWFRRSPDSPLTPADRAAFQGLRYFPENEALRLVVHPEQFDGEEVVTMQTTTGGVQEYVRWGRFAFDVDGETAMLTVYYAPWGEYFVPFTDATSGAETYGAGRYMALEPHAGGAFLADFNMAYNPYCAYNDEYSCPIPPAENRLAVPIRAGELAFH